MSEKLTAKQRAKEAAWSVSLEKPFEWFMLLVITNIGSIITYLISGGYVASVALGFSLCLSILCLVFGYLTFRKYHRNLQLENGISQDEILSLGLSTTEKLSKSNLTIGSDVKLLEIENQAVEPAETHPAGLEPQVVDIEPPKRHFPHIDRNNLIIAFRKDDEFIEEKENYRKLFIKIINNTGETIGFLKTQITEINEVDGYGEKSFDLMNSSVNTNIGGLTIVSGDWKFLEVAVQLVSNRREVRFARFQIPPKSGNMLAVKFTFSASGVIHQMANKQTNPILIGCSKEFVLYVDAQDLLQIEEVK